MSHNVFSNIKFIYLVKILTLQNQPITIKHKHKHQIKITKQLYIFKNDINIFFDTPFMGLNYEKCEKNYVPMKNKFTYLVKIKPTKKFKP